MAVATAGKSKKQLMEERADLVQKAQAYHNEHDGDDWSEEHNQKFDEMMTDAEAYQSAIKRVNQLESLVAAQGDGEATAALGLPLDDPNATPTGEADAAAPLITMRVGRTPFGRPHYAQGEALTPERAQPQYRKTFANYLRFGPRAGNALAGLHEIQGPGQYATLQSDLAPRAGFLVPDQEFAAGLLRNVDDLVYIRQRARVFTVAEASSLGVRMRKTKASTFAYSAELQVSDEDSSLAYGKKVLTPHPLTGQIEMSRDLARRSAMAVGEIQYEMARDSGEVQEKNFLTGDGNQKPLGVLINSADGIGSSRDVKSGALTDFTSDGILDAKYHLKQQYRRGQRGSVAWMMHRDAIKRIAKLKDNDGQYLFRVGVGFASDNGMPEDELVGYPVDESEIFPNTYSTGAYGAILAAWQYYYIADALDMEIQVLEELKARENKYVYIGRLKNDGMPQLEEAFVRIEMGT